MDYYAPCNTQLETRNPKLNELNKSKELNELYQTLPDLQLTNRHTKLGKISRDQSMTVQDEIKKLNIFFSKQRDKPEVTLAYMFGSRADKSAGHLSDYDIAVLYSILPPDTTRYRLSHLLAKKLCTGRIDLVLLNRAPVELKYAVIASGILLYQKTPAVRVEFEAHTLSLYGDYLPILRRQRKEILEDRKYEAGIQRYRTALAKTQCLLAEIRTV